MALRLPRWLDASAHILAEVTTGRSSVLRLPRWLDASAHYADQAVTRGASRLRLPRWLDASAHAADLLAPNLARLVETPALARRQRARARGPRCAVSGRC